MITIRQLIYYVQDLLKLTSDDSIFNEEHIFFCLQKSRAAILQQLSTKNVGILSDTENQITFTVNLEETDRFGVSVTHDIPMLRSKEAIPAFMYLRTDMAIPQILPFIQNVDRSRFRFVGRNRFLNSVIYTTVGDDKHLYVRSGNPDFLNLEQIVVSCVPTNIDEAVELMDDKAADLYDNPFPMAEEYIPMVIDMVCKEISGGSWRPEDSYNNAKDDLANLATFLARNAKSNIQKQIAGDA